MKTINIKTKWSDVTVKEWVIISSILSSEFFEIEEKLEKIALLLSDLTIEELINLKVNDYSKIINKVSFVMKEPEKTPILKSIKVAGRSFDVDTNLNEVVTGQYYMAQNIMKQEDEVFDKIKKILGVYIRPKGKSWGEFDYEENVEFLYNNLTIDVGYSAGVFFYHIANKYMIASQTCLEKMKKQELKQKKIQKNPVHSTKPGD